MSLAFLLKSFSEEDKPKVTPKVKDEISLTGVLQRKRLAYTKQKAYRQASPYFYPGQLYYGYCEREKVAQLAGLHKVLIKPPTPKEQLIFDIGNAYHDLIQGYFWKAGLLEGQFRCLICNSDWWDRSPSHCSAGHNRRFLEFREVPLKDEALRLSGRADGLIWLEYRKQEVQQFLEIKSISNKPAEHSSQDPRIYFEDLDEHGPLDAHIVQINLYMKLKKIYDGHILYVAKNGHQMKSFHLTYNGEMLEPHLHTIKQTIEWAEDIKQGRRSDLPAPCPKEKCACHGIIMTHDKSTRATSNDTVH